MRIFPALFRYKMPGGNIFRGKYKIVFPATPRDVSNLKYDFEIEEKNMFYLRHPYLTPEQSSGHAKALGKKEARNIMILTGFRKPYYDNVTIEHRLGIVRKQEQWD